MEKMKLLCPLILLYVHFLKGQQSKETYEPIFLNFTFSSVYNNHTKMCCKLYPGRCDELMDSRGFSFESVKGRVTNRKGRGWIEFKISNVQLWDAGQYRCQVVRADPHLYQDYTVILSEVSDDDIQSSSSVAPTIKPRSSSATFPQSTSSVLGEDPSNDRKAAGSFDLLLTVIVSMAAMLLFISLIGVILCRFKGRKLAKTDEIPHESSKEEAVEPGGLVYVTVGFRARQEQPKVHENPRMHETSEEYSVLACHQ